MNVKEIFETMEYGPAPESTNEADKWLEAHGRKFGHFINGEFIDASGHFPTKGPADGVVLADIGDGSSADVDAAVAAARKAQGAWAKLGGAERAKYLYAIARLVNKHARLFAVLETMDNGKPIRESRDIDIPLVIRHFYHHAGWAQLMDSEMPGYAALGVAGQIIPWNFPMLMLSWKIAPAIAMGNTVVLKPAEFTSLTALLFAEICVEAGLPKGVVNIVTGAGATGAAITAHSDIDKIAFTGSTEVGRIIRKATAGSGKKLTLELGGKSPFIVFDDADIDSAVEGVVDAIWFNQGQVCCAGSRLLMHETIADKMLHKLEARMARLRVGNPMDKCIDIGAIIDESQLKIIQSMVAKGVADGARLIQPETALPNGCYYPPTLLADVEAADIVMQEEIFGPVLVSTTFRTPAEAIALANNTKYGLAASVWTENINLAYEIAPKIKAGVVWINCTNQFDAAAGFGGMRESGFGREGGREGLFEYVKPTYMQGLKPSTHKHPEPSGEVLNAAMDRTAKMYIGGKQARPDSGYATPVIAPNGALITHVGAGNRKDIRNAVEAAAKARGWGAASGHNRAQVLYFIAENLSARAMEFTDRIVQMVGVNKGKAEAEVEATITRLFTYAAWADKFDGAVHNVPMRGVAMAMHEPVGIMGIICPDAAPLLGMVSLIAPAIAMGNTCVVVPSAAHPLAATDFYQVLETSDLPSGVVNIVTGPSDDLGRVLGEHYEVDALWHFGSKEGGNAAEEAASANLKRTWISGGLARDWYDAVEGEGREFLRQATEVKNIWTPYGE
ncbi:MAG: aldehyde dehydrogenase family protein [Paracoccaceae bacterium]